MIKANEFTHLTYSELLALSNGHVNSYIITFTCPLTGELKSANSNEASIEDRAVFILCPCGSIHDI